MLAKIYPAKRLPDPKNKGKTITIRLPDPLDYYCVSMEDVRDHLAKPESWKINDKEEGLEFTEQTGLPAYVDELTGWLMDAIASSAANKARSAFTVKGTDPKALEVEVTGTLPSTLDELLASNRGGGIIAKQKVAFIEAFEVWAEANLPKHEMYLRAFKRVSFKGTDPRGWPHIRKAINDFLATLDDPTAYEVYTTSAFNQLKEEEADDWGSLPT